MVECRDSKAGLEQRSKSHPPGRQRRYSPPCSSIESHLGDFGSASNYSILADGMTVADAALGREYTSEKVRAYICQHTCGFSSLSKHQYKLSNGTYNGGRGGGTINCNVSFWLIVSWCSVNHTYNVRPCVNTFSNLPREADTFVYEPPTYSNRYSAIVVPSGDSSLTISQIPPAICTISYVRGPSLRYPTI